MARRTILLFLLFSTLILAGCEKKEPPRLRSICMAAVADTLVVPDLVVWTVQMNDLDPLLLEAKRGNDEKLAAVLGALEKIDLLPGSLRTGPASIQRQFRRCDDGVNRFSHFSVRRTVTFQQDDPEAVEKTLDILVAAADIESSCTFELADPETIMKTLRTRAMDQARGKVEALAAHAGKAVGALLSINVHEDMNLFRRQHHRHDPNAGIAGPEAQMLSTQVRVSYETL